MIKGKRIIEGGMYEEQNQLETCPLQCDFFNEGLIGEENEPKELFGNPQNPRLKEFLSSNVRIMV